MSGSDSSSSSSGDESDTMEVDETQLQQLEDRVILLSGGGLDFGEDSAGWADSNPALSTQCVCVCWAGIVMLL